MGERRVWDGDKGLLGCERRPAELGVRALGCVYVSGTRIMAIQRQSQRMIKDVVQ